MQHFDAEFYLDMMFDYCYMFLQLLLCFGEFILCIV